MKKGIFISALTLVAVLLVGCGGAKSNNTDTSISLNEEGKKAILDSSKEVRMSE